jgi:hypothetical protein
MNEWQKQQWYKEVIPNLPSYNTKSQTAIFMQIGST